MVFGCLFRIVLFLASQHQHHLLSQFGEGRNGLLAHSRQCGNWGTASSLVFLCFFLWSLSLSLHVQFLSLPSSSLIWLCLFYLAHRLIAGALELLCCFAELKLRKSTLFIRCPLFMVTDFLVSRVRKTYISGLSLGISLPEYSCCFAEAKSQGNDQWFKLFLGLCYSEH